MHGTELDAVTGSAKSAIQSDETNRTAQTYGLILSEQDAKLLLKERGRALKKEKRVEFCLR